MVIHAPSTSTISPLAKRYDSNGKVWIYVKWVADATAKQGKLIVMGQTGWVSADPFDVAATQTLGHAYVGFPEVAQTTNTYGWAQIGGPISDAVIGTTTGTVGHAVAWVDTKFVSGGNSKQGQGRFAIFTATGASGTSHDLMLFDVPIGGTT